MEPPETYTFSADIAQLMGVIVSTVYANKEIFLRELVSNASDALERRHHGADDLPSSGDACIRVYPDAARGTLTVEDTGVGMSREDLVDSLGTIARSKTKAFLESATGAGADPSLIGQFGIGFYSAYVVSERVRVVSRSADSDEQYVWESTAGGAFTIAQDSALEHGVLQRGTKVVCFLKEGQQEFLDSAHLRQLLMRHSCFVKWPLYLYADRCVLDFDRQTAVEEAAPEASVLLTRGWELMSRIRPVWLESATDVSAREYNEVYRWLEGDTSMSEALAIRHVEQSGNQQVDFRALLFCAQRAPSDIFDLVGGRTRGSRVRLFVRRVFVKEFDDILPKWMAFACGVVDSDDLPLNISREQLQKESTVMRLIGRILVRQCFEMLESLAANAGEFRIFHDMFGQNLKLGVYEDSENRGRIVPLLRFHTTESGDDIISLQQYVDRMRPTQHHILYVTGRSRRQALQSPLIEGFRRDGHEVLLMTDPADEFALQVLKEFGGRELMSATTVHAASEGAGMPAEDAVRKDARRRRSLEQLRRSMKATLDADGLECEVAFADYGISGGPFPAVMKSGSSGQRCLELDASCGLFEELAKKLAAPGTDGPLGRAERELVVLLHDMASALLPGQGADNTERRRRVGEQLQEMVRRLDGADRDADDEDLPSLPLEPLPAASWEGDAAFGACGWPPRAVAAASPESWPPVGGVVRVLGEGRARRGIVTLVDEGANTVDVLYTSCHGAVSGSAAEEEAEGVPVDTLMPLLAFESERSERDVVAQSRDWSEGVVPSLCKLKEQGNELYRIKDFDAALEWYTAAIDAIQRIAPLETGQRVLRVAAIDGARRLVRSVVWRRLPAPKEEEAPVLEVEDESGSHSATTATVLLPVLGAVSLRPTLERAAAFKGMNEAILEQIAVAAAPPADSVPELLSTHTALFANRARCWSALGHDRRAAQDLTTARGLWEAFAAASPQGVGPAAAPLVVRGLCTAEYLRGRARLRRGLFRGAARDARDALAREPPPSLAKQLHDFQMEVMKAMSERHRVREPLARELAKVVFVLRTASL